VVPPNGDYLTRRGEHLRNRGLPAGSGSGACSSPHRAPEQPEEVIRCAVVVTWAETMALVPDQTAASLWRALVDEVRRRIEFQPLALPP
jgi:hypothetical protein